MLNSINSICDTMWITTENNFVHLQNYKIYSSCTCDLQSKSTTVLRATPKFYCFCILQLVSAKTLDLFSLPVLFEDFKTYRIVHLDKSHHFKKTVQTTSQEWIDSTHVHHDCFHSSNICANIVHVQIHMAKKIWFYVVAARTSGDCADVKNYITATI